MAVRDVRIDNAKGVLIILVVLGHLVWPVPSKDKVTDALYFLVYTFHMPMFALISGYLSRIDTGWAGVVKSAKLLLIPYCIFAGLQWGASFLLGVDLLPLHEGHYGLWFLLSLFCWRTVLPVVVRIPYALPVTICAALACGFVPFIGMELSLSRSIVLLPFFLAGHMMREQSKSPMEFVGRLPALIILLGATLFAVFLSGFNLHGMLYGNGSYASLGPSEAVGLAARGVQYVVGFAAGLAVLSLTPLGESLLTRIGRHSLYVYLLHSLLLVFYRAWPVNYGFIGENVLLLVPTTLLVCLLLSARPVVRAVSVLISPFGSSK